MMAQNDLAGGYTYIRYAGFCLDNDSSDSDSINRDSDIDRDSVFQCFHLKLSFVIVKITRVVSTLK